MEVTIKGEAKEIAALVAALQERQNQMASDLENYVPMEDG